MAGRSGALGTDLTYLSGLNELLAIPIPYQLDYSMLLAVKDSWGFLAEPLLHFRLVLGDKLS